MSKVEIKSDGTCVGTKIVVDGKELGNVFSLDYHLSTEDKSSLGILTLKIRNVNVDVKGEFVLSSDAPLVVRQVDSVLQKQFKAVEKKEKPETTLKPDQGEKHE